jgi:ABC-type amino acid transport substrate-binding protein
LTVGLLAVLALVVKAVEQLCVASQNPSARLVGDRFTDERHGVATSRPELLPFVNGVFDRIRTDGPWATIYTHWLCGPRPPTPVE